MDEQKRTRYPGAQPFTDDALSRKLFKGREQEATALTHQILAHKLVVLFARSGLGKTSLLNAGVVESLRAEQYLPLIVRVNDSNQGPMATIYSGIEEACKCQAIEYIPGEKTSLWHFFKSTQFWSKDILLTPILILDQFEELFTLHSEQMRGDFLDQLSNLARGVRPKEPEPTPLQEGEPEAIYSDAAPAVKIIISLREDFLAQLDEISDRIPEILNQRFRLLPLGRVAATKALEAPAEIEDTLLASQPFHITQEASEEILNFLERRAATTARSTNNIEPFQLQLICHHIEEIAQNAQRKNTQGTAIAIGMNEIGGRSRLLKILKEFYKRQVAAVPSIFQRKGVQKLCSEHLINPQGRRIRMEESEIQRLTNVKPETLQILVERRLLRRDQSIHGNYYELSHDSLITPIMDTVRFRFLVRMVFLLMVGIVIGIFFFSSLAALATNVWSYFTSALPTSDFSEFSLLAVSILVVLWLIVKWGIRNFHDIKEMWHRFRIE